MPESREKPYLIFEEDDGYTAKRSATSYEGKGEYLASAILTREEAKNLTDEEVLQILHQNEQSLEETVVRLDENYQGEGDPEPAIQQNLRELAKVKTQIRKLQS